MADSFEVSAPDLNRAVYVAIASVKEDPRLDVIAGVTCHLLLQHPQLSAARIGEHIAALGQAVEASSPNPQFDRSMDDSIYMCRILARLTPHLAGSVLPAAARDFSRAFLNSYRRGLDLFRQVAPLDTQIDRFGEVNRFRRDTWEKLYELASQRPQTAQALDNSLIAERLGVKTSQDAPALLAAAPIPALAGFVADHLQPDGSLAAGLPDIHTGIAAVSTSAAGSTSAYIANLFDLDCWEQAFKDLFSVFCPEDEKAKKEEKKTDLEKAIEKTEGVQKELDEALGDVRAGVKGTLDVFAFLIRDDKDLAADVKKLTDITVALLDDARKYSKEAISAAKKLTNLLGLDVTDFAAISAIGFTVGVIAIGIKIFDILGKKEGPSIDQQILQQVKQISTQIKDLRKEMNVRFDRIEKQLNAMLDSMLEQFARIDFDLGQIEGNVEEIQFGLYNLHSALQRMNRNIHTFLEAAHRRELVEAINGFLDFRERTGQDLDFAAFLTGENEFYSWGFSHAQDPLQAGPAQRSFQDRDLFAELDSFPLATNVNFLREFPAARFSLPPLALNRLANPSDWITASEGYAQLSEESPAHAANISAERVQDLVEVGERLGDSLSRIADNNLFGALSTHYLAQFAALKAAIAAFEAEFRNDPAHGLAGIDLFGGANQVPKSHFLDRPRELPRCDNKSFGGGVNTLTTDLAAFDHHELAPYMIASNLGLGKLDACIFATWTKKSVTPIFGERFNVVFQLVIKIRIRFSGATVFEHTFDPKKTFSKVLLRKELDTFNPNAFNEPHEPLPGLWSKLGTFPATHSLVNPGLRTATITAVEAALVLAQRAFYAQVAQRLIQAGDPIQEAGERLDGARLLWQSFVAMGLPLSVERNDFLRGLLFGSEGILSGTDAGSEDGLLDDVQDIYTFIATREEAPPAANIIADVETLLQERVQTLLATLAAIVASIEASGEPEPPQLFAPTLLRLSLIESRPA